ncbi:hypothetical protein KY284_024385 [Solanum tuberosum]|nr:hypothetical protein KY284_024385 [Solanum tuberosum]
MDNTENVPNLKKQLGDEVVVVMVPFQTQSHLDPFLQFACLISSYGLSVHYLSLPTYNHDTKTRATALNPSDLANIHFHDLQMTPTPLDPDIPSEDISSFDNAESYIFNPVISAFGMYCDHIFPMWDCLFRLNNNYFKSYHPLKDGIAMKSCGYHLFKFSI